MSTGRTARKTTNSNSPVLVPFPASETFVAKTVEPMTVTLLCTLVGDYIEMNTGESHCMFDFYRVPGGLFTAPEKWRKNLEEVIAIRSLNGYRCQSTRRVAAVLATATAMSLILIKHANIPRTHKASEALMRHAYGKQWLTDDERIHLVRLAD